jgi:hypothetical protein
MDKERSSRMASRKAAALALLCTVSFFALILPLLGCSSSKEEQIIRNATTTLLNEYKHPSREDMIDLVDADTRRAYDQLELYGVDGYAIAQQFLAKFDYTIDEVSVKDDRATVSITMKNIDVADIVDSTLAKYSSNKGRETIGQLQESGGDSLVYQRLYSELYIRLKKAKEIVSIPTALTLTKTNGSWKVDETCIPTIMAAIYGGRGIDTLL